MILLAVAAPCLGLDHAKSASSSVKYLNVLPDSVLMLHNGTLACSRG
jgi:hypothetical protein